MKRHPVIGDDLCRTVRFVRPRCGRSSAITTKRLDGRGYPRRPPRPATAIPACSRRSSASLTVFDALHQQTVRTRKALTAATA